MFAEAGSGSVWLVFCLFSHLTAFAQGRLAVLPFLDLLSQLGRSLSWQETDVLLLSGGAVFSLCFSVYSLMVC